MSIKVDFLGDIPFLSLYKGDTVRQSFLIKQDTDVEPLMQFYDSIVKLDALGIKVTAAFKPQKGEEYIDYTTDSDKYRSIVQKLQEVGLHG